MSGTATNNGSVPLPMGYGLHPQDVPKSVTALFDWTAASAYSHELPEGENRLRVVQTVYVDNSQNSQIVVLIIAGSEQRIAIPASVLGYFPVVMTPGNHRLTVTSFNGTNYTTIQFLNMPIPPFMWSV